jgi:hypothetical protein
MWPPDLTARLAVFCLQAIDTVGGWFLAQLPRWNP